LSVKRIKELSSSGLSFEALEREEKVIRNKLLQDRKEDSWRVTFKRRDILKRFVHDFVSKHVARIGYEEFRDLIIGRMRDAKFEPHGMREVIHAILEDD
jgi:hypothetical protein